MTGAALLAFHVHSKAAMPNPSSKCALLVTISMPPLRCEIAASLLNSGADTLAYAAGNHCLGGTRWKSLLVSACARTEENYLQVQVAH